MDNTLQRDLELWRIVRKQMGALLENKKEAELLKVPPGLANNMLWIYGHVIRSADFLIRKQAGAAMLFPSDLDPYFQKGSSPALWKDTTGLRDRVFAAEETCREGLLNYLESAEGNRSHANEYPTSLGFTLRNVADGVRYNLVHESLHLGQLQMYGKLVSL